MRTDTRIQTYALNDRLRIQPFHLRIGVQFIEIADAQSQIRISEQFNRLRFGQTHDTRLDILLERSFLQQLGKTLGCGFQTSIAQDRTDDDTAGV